MSPNVQMPHFCIKFILPSNANPSRCALPWAALTTGNPFPTSPSHSSHTSDDLRETPTFSNPTFRLAEEFHLFTARQAIANEPGDPHCQSPERGTHPRRNRRRNPEATAIPAHHEVQPSSGATNVDISPCGSSPSDRSTKVVSVALGLLTGRAMVRARAQTVRGRLTRLPRSPVPAGGRRCAGPPPQLAAR